MLFVAKIVFSTDLCHRSNIFNISLTLSYHRHCSFYLASFLLYIVPDLPLVNLMPLVIECICMVKSV